MNSTDSIRVEMQDGLAIVSLAQPARGNPFDGAFARDFKQVASALLDDAQLQDEALALARRLAAGPTVAYGATKRLFMQAGAAQLEAQLEDEALTLARVSGTQDAQEGIAAQVEKRKPVFRGR